MHRRAVIYAVYFAAALMVTETTKRAKRVGDDPDPLQVALQQLSAKMDALEADLQAESQSVRTELNRTAMNITEQLNNQSQQIQYLESRGAHTVAFLARAASTDNHPSHPAEGTLIQFSSEILDVGGAYKRSLSKFVAPEEGDYWMYFHVAETGARSLEISVNGRGVAQCDFEHVLTALTCGVVTHLNAGDEVTVVHGTDGSGHIQDGPDTYFTGFLLH